VNPVAWLVSRQLTELAGSWDERLSFSGDDDGEYICKLVSRSVIGRFAPEARGYHRVGNSGTLRSKGFDRALRSFFLSTCVSI
jgi:hypothetical protein